MFVIRFLRKKLDTTNPKLSIGYSHFHLESRRERYRVLPGSEFDLFQSETIELSNEISLLNLRYVLSESFPVFLSVGFGREFRGNKYSFTQFIPRSSSLRPDINGNITVFSPHYLFSIGFGYQKILENGMLFGFSYNGMNSLDATIKSRVFPVITNIDLESNNLSLWAGFAF